MICMFLLDIMAYYYNLKIQKINKIRLEVIIPNDQKILNPAS